MVRTSTRFRIVGIETAAAGVFYLLSSLAQQAGPGFARYIPAFNTEGLILGFVLVLVGLETLDLARRVRP